MTEANTNLNKKHMNVQLFPEPDLESLWQAFCRYFNQTFTFVQTLGVNKGRISIIFTWKLLMNEYFVCLCV